MIQLLSKNEVMTGIVERCRLSPISPVTSKRSGIESIPSFLNRLSRHNNLKPDILIKAYGKTRLGNPTSFSRYHTRTSAAELELAFDAYYAENIVNLIASYTGKKDIFEIYTRDTALILDVIEKHSPEIYKWCSHCLAEQQTIYFPLHWQLSSVSACHIHKAPLNTLCSSCGQKPQLLKATSVVGYCHYCGSDLSLAKTKVSPSEKDLAISENYMRLLSGAFN